MSVLRMAGAARRWFRAFRRTRPFWGGLWLILAGLVVIRVMYFPIGVAMSGGFNTSAGFILGGAMVLFGLVAWCAPHYAGLVGLLGVLAALAAFVGANLGGFLVGTILGIVGGSMVWGWGEKSPPSGRRGTSRARRAGRSSKVRSGELASPSDGRVEIQRKRAHAAA